MQLKTQTFVRGFIVLGAFLIGMLIYVLLTTNDHPLVGVGGVDGELGGAFSLDGVDGPVSLSDFEGKVVVMYFGFLKCKRVCPNSMNVIQRTLGRMDDAEKAQIQALMVSIDPKRDKVEDLKGFAEKYRGQIIGLTGSEEQIDRVSRDYGAYFEITKADKADDDYEFEHSSRYYIIDQSGKLVDAMRHSTTATELAARIRTLI